MKIWKEVLIVATLSALTSAGVASAVSGAVMPGKEPPWMKSQVSGPSIAQATNPDPFNVQKTAQAPAAPTPVVVPAPQVTVQTPPASTTPDILQWIWTALAGLGVAIFGKNSLFPGSGASSDPKVVADQALLKLLQSGVLQGPVQAGLGMIPTVGPIAAQLEPMVKQWVLQILNQRLGGAVQTASGQLSGMPQPLGDPQQQAQTQKVDPLGDFLNRIEATIQAAVAKGKTQ